jgi:hypothetical protein
MMKCEEYRNQFADWYMERLDAAKKAELEGHLDTCADCREALAATQFVLDSISNLPDPEPSARVRADFRTMLDEFKAVEEKNVPANGFWGQLKRSWALQPRFSLAYSLMVLLVCVSVVFLISRDSKQEADVRDLRAQLNVKQTKLLALLDNPLASERMKAVNYTGEMKHVDGRVINALLTTLNNDPNDNVRLSTLEALAALGNQPEVRTGLIKSITMQNSPVIQLAIADVMLKLQEKRSVGSFKALLKQKDLDNEVKRKLKETITKLI